MSVKENILMFVTRKSIELQSTKKGYEEKKYEENDRSTRNSISDALELAAVPVSVGRGPLKQDLMKNRIEESLTSAEQQLLANNAKLAELEKLGTELVDSFMNSEADMKYNLTIDWFALIMEKTRLAREQADLTNHRRECELQKERLFLEGLVDQLNAKHAECLEMTKRISSTRERLLKRVVTITEKRDELVHSIHKDKYRYDEEDRTLRKSLREQGLTKSTIYDEDFQTLLQSEPEVWSNTMDEKILKEMDEAEIKRQNCMWELVCTEANFCRSLKAIDQVIARGLVRELGMDQESVDQIIPQLNDLTNFHLEFLSCMRGLQRQPDKMIDTIGQCLLKQFSGPKGETMKAIYGTFCRQKENAVIAYHKQMQKNDHFKGFIQCYGKSESCGRREIPDFLLMISSRLMKYPLLIERILKASKDKEERDDLTQALSRSREIIQYVENNMQRSSKS